MVCMTNFSESAHDRDHTGRFTEMAGSAPEGSALLAPEHSTPDDRTPNRSADQINGEYAVAIQRYQTARFFTGVLAAQSVAAAVRQEHPEAASLVLSPNFDADGDGYWVDHALDRDGNRIDLSDDLTDDIGAALYDIPTRHDVTYLSESENGSTTTLDLDGALNAPVGDIDAERSAYVPPEHLPAPEQGVLRTERAMRGWVDLPTSDLSSEDAKIETEQAVRDAMTDLVHFCDKHDLPVHDLLHQGAQLAAEEREGQRL
jgi:hypothetical protein